MGIRFILTLVLSVVIAIFAIYNNDAVTVNFIYKEFQIPQAIVIIISAILGAVIVAFINTIKKAKLKKEIKTRNMELDKLRIEIAESYKEITDFREKIKAVEENLDGTEKELEEEKQKVKQMFIESEKANDRAEALSKEIEVVLEKLELAEKAK